MAIELTEVKGHCPICLQDKQDLPYSCTGCTCKVCDPCMSRMLEEGEASRCPLCRREEQWCEQLESPGADTCPRLRNVLASAIMKTMRALTVLTMLWAVGAFTVLLAGQSVCVASCDKPWLHAMMYVFVGILVAGSLGAICTCVCMCIISVLSLGTSHEGG